MPGILALLLVIVVVFLIFFSESLQKKKMEEQLHTVTGNQKVLYGSMATLTFGTGFARGYFAITERYLYFIESKKDGLISVTLKIRLEDILSHKLHFVLFIEDNGHNVYEIKAANNAAANAILVKQLESLSK